jgi:hypothetical protein
MSAEKGLSRVLQSSPRAADNRPRRVFWFTLIPVIASVALALFWQTPGHNWGDDFAGYLLQAQALLHGTPAEEVQLNARLEAASDWRTGPDAYPWGYPAILALVMSAFGPGLATLKMISIVSMGVITLTAGLLTSVSRLTLTSAVCVAIAVGMQPDLTSLGNDIASDVVFLALTGVALLFAALALDAVHNRFSPAWTRWATIIAAVFVSLSYFVRSNGAVTLVAIAASMVAVPAFTQRLDARRIAMSVAPFALVCAALIIPYHAVLPDGSVVHLGYLTVEPSSLVRRTIAAMGAFGTFFPIFILPKPLEHLAVLVLGVLAVLGAQRLGRIGLLLTLYSAGHIVLVILFPYSGGQRYYLPILFALAVLAAAGVERLAGWVALKWPVGGDRRIAGTLLATLLFVGAIASNYYRLGLRAERSIDGPYSPAARELFGYLRAQPSDIEPVAFFKPRAMRLLAGKEAILVGEIASTRSVNSIAIFWEPQAADWQLSGQLNEAQVAALSDFRPTFRNERFTFYVRTRGLTDSGSDPTLVESLPPR